MCVGIIGATGTNEIDRTTSTQVHVTDLENLNFGVDWNYQSTGEYILSWDAYKYLCNLKKLEGYGTGYSYSEEPLFSASVADPKVKTLLGYNFSVQNFRNIADNAALAALGAKGDAIFGDFTQYAYGVEKDVTVERDDSFAFDKNMSTFRLNIS